MVQLSSKTVAAFAVAALSALASAQERPNTTSVCDFYANKTVGSTSAADQRTIMQLVLHTALFGAFSKYNQPVPGLTGALKPTVFDGEYVDLNGYFNGGFASTNEGGTSGASADFYDDGGLEVLLQLQPDKGNLSSHQSMFYRHVYSYFGTFLGCSDVGSPELPIYAGKASMYDVHKYMYLSKAEMGFFIDQATRGLLSIGFSNGDAQFVNTTLDAVFNRRCAPATAVIPPTAVVLQAICTAPDCILSPNDTCSAYDALAPPAVANATLIGGYSKAPNGTTTLNATTTAAPTSKPTASTAAAPALVDAMFSGWETVGTIVGAVVVAFGLI